MEKKYALHHRDLLNVIWNVPTPVPVDHCETGNSGGSHDMHGIVNICVPFMFSGADGGYDADGEDSQGSDGDKEEGYGENGAEMK